MSDDARLEALVAQWVSRCTEAILPYTDKLVPFREDPDVLEKGRLAYEALQTLDDTPYEEILRLEEIRIAEAKKQIAQKRTSIRNDLAMAKAHLAHLKRCPRVERGEDVLDKVKYYLSAVIDGAPTSLFNLDSQEKRLQPQTRDAWLQERRRALEGDIWACDQHINAVRRSQVYVLPLRKALGLPDLAD